MDYKLDTKRVTWSNEEKKKGWRQTGKADESERQLSTEAATDQRNRSPWHFNPVQWTAWRQLFMTMYTDSSHWEPSPTFIPQTPHRPQPGKPNKHHTAPLIYSSKRLTSGRVSAFAETGSTARIISSAENSSSFSAHGCICQTNQNPQLLSQSLDVNDSIHG